MIQTLSKATTTVQGGLVGTDFRTAGWPQPQQKGQVSVGHSVVTHIARGLSSGRTVV